MIPPARARTRDSSITEQITGVAPKPSARRVAISRLRAATALYIVFNAPSSAPSAIINAITVPMLEMNGHRITQSLAICNYVNSIVPEPPFMPANAADRAHVLALALTVACDIHPLNNLRVLKYLKAEFGAEQEATDAWYRHWVAEGLATLETMAAPRAGAWLFGDAPSVADICLIPQLYNARRFSVPLDSFPTLRRVDETASGNPAFAAAHPDLQEQPR